MKFSDAYIEMLKGHKMTRPCFKGYWYVNGKIGKLVIHLESGDEITEGDLTLTIQNTIAEDWDYYYEPLCSLSEYSCKKRECLEMDTLEKMKKIYTCEDVDYGWADDYEDCEEREEQPEPYVDYTDGIGDEYVYVGDIDASALCFNEPIEITTPITSEYVTEKFEDISCRG